MAWDEMPWASGVLRGSGMLAARPGWIATITMEAIKAEASDLVVMFLDKF
jgi:hypothetical protein